MKLKTLVIFLYLVISIPLFLVFKVGISVWISFFMNYLLISFLAYYHLNLEKNYSPFLSSYIIFNFLFFIVAPLIQINSIASNSALFPNNFPYQTWNVVYTNILIFCFNSLFFLGYLFFKKKQKVTFEKKENQDVSYYTPLVILLIFFLSLGIAILNYDFLVMEFIRPNWSSVSESVGSTLIRKKVLFLVPFGGIVVTFRYLQVKKIITDNTIISFLILILLLFLLIFFKNPFTEKRNALGPIYITLIYLFYPKVLNSNAKTFLFLFITMIIFFPLVSSLTHVDGSFEEIIANPKLVMVHFEETGGILSVFKTLHYDAFANVMATVEYVANNGFSYGYQLLSALLFFIPRSMWSSKPLSTGEVVGNYLIDKHEFNFSNLSNPLVSEGFINFGFIGVLLMAIVLSYFVVYFLKWIRSGDSLKSIAAFYFAMHMMFLLRGDFTNGFAYFIGTLIGILVIPKLLIKVFEK